MVVVVGAVEVVAVALLSTDVIGAVLCSSSRLLHIENPCLSRKNENPSKPASDFR